MTSSKKYFYDYEDYEDGDKDASTLIEEILEDEDLEDIKELIIGCWGEVYDESAQQVIDGIVENKEKFQHIESLFVGDMSYEECEVSWIIQGNYNSLLKALPNLKKLTIKGSSELQLGELSHENLEDLEIICGGLPQNVLKEIATCHLPNIKKLNLYLGVENYGFDGDIKDIQEIVKNPYLQKLEYLGLGNSEIQDQVVEAVLNSSIIKNLKVLDFSNGTLSDKGAQILLDHADELSHLELLDLHYHYISDDYITKLKKLPINMDLSEQNECDYYEYKGETYMEMYPMLTE
ncbi:STM4015 family protein [Inediibacterium massiliense]|uniref:STM4015 family protein n=1 Tax=Inediibacterium massiliense TaxID=1658111 RepID=UPI0006B47DCC|nr:STM4015 family protein [Inediibacterium massiliense]